MSKMIDGQLLTLYMADGQEVSHFFNENPNPLCALISNWIKNGDIGLVELPGKRQIINFSYVVSLEMNPLAQREGLRPILTLENISKLA